MDLLTALGAILIISVLLLLLTQRVRRGRETALRPLSAYANMPVQMGAAIESGSELHISLGQASLADAASPASVAALTVLDQLAADGCANGRPPLVTVGEGTLLPAAQDSLRHAFTEANRSGEYHTYQAEFVATDTDPFAYAAGVSGLIQQNKVSSNILVGRFGPELTVMAEAARRQDTDQVIGTDDPVALAVATAVTDQTLVGEELFASGAYLQGTSSQIASLQLQDLLRLVISLTILGLAIYQIIS